MTPVKMTNKKHHLLRVWQRIPKVKFLEEAWMDYDQQEDIQVFRVWQRLPKTMSPEEAWKDLHRKEAIHVQHMLQKV